MSSFIRNYICIAFLITTFLLGSFAQEQQSTAQVDEFKYETILDHDNRVRLKWNVNKASKQIQFKLMLVDFRLPLLVGFGASDRGSFRNADLVVFEIKTLSSNISFLDCHTDHNGFLRVDPNSNSDYVFEEFKVILNKAIQIIKYVLKYLLKIILKQKMGYINC